jgi:uncharacterized membrane protein
MSDLIVMYFNGQDTVDQVRNRLYAMRKEHLINLEDAYVAVRDSRGHVRLKQAITQSPEYLR